MSVPIPVSSGLQVPVGFHASVWCLTSDTAARAFSPTQVLPASYFDRDSEQITTSEALLILHEGPISVISVGWNYPGDPGHLPDSGYYSDFGLLTGLWGHTPSPVCISRSLLWRVWWVDCNEWRTDICICLTAISRSRHLSVYFLLFFLCFVLVPRRTPTADTRP